VQAAEPSARVPSPNTQNIANLRAYHKLSGAERRAESFGEGFPAGKGSINMYNTLFLIFLRLKYHLKYPYTKVQRSCEENEKSLDSPMWQTVY
jgi:hypothetical protein